jgi:hypothetical protein
MCRRGQVEPENQFSGSMRHAPPPPKRSRSALPSPMHGGGPEWGASDTSGLCLQRPQWSLRINSQAQCDMSAEADVAATRKAHILPLVVRCSETAASLVIHRYRYCLPLVEAIIDGNCSVDPLNNQPVCSPGPLQLNNMRIVRRGLVNEGV